MSFKGIHDSTSKEEVVDLHTLSIVDASVEDSDTHLKRTLKDRHISLIALAGIIGPGILIGASLALANGPASLIIGFGVIGLIAFAMMQSLGELATLYPTGGTFSTLGNRLVDPAYGAAVGWNYVIIWIAVLANEYNTVAAIMQFWGPQVPLYGYILIFWVFFLAFQFLGVQAFGEAEFWLALTKIIGLVAFYIFAIIYVAGGIHGQKAFGFHYWNDPGAFNGGFKGVASTFVFASTFYSGTEIVAVSAAEAKNPSKAVPSAIRQTFWRILIIYMGIAISYGLTVPFNDPSLSAGTKTLKSPMTIAIARAGWEGGAHLINAFILVTCISAINSSIYIGSRTIVNLANEGAAPKFLRWVNGRGVPYMAVILMNLFGFLSLMNISTGAAKAYGYIVNLSGVAVFIVWGNVCFYQIRFRKAWKLQGRSVSELPYRGLWFPVLPILGIALNIFLALIQGWSFFKPFDAGNWVDAYILIPFFGVLFIFFKLVNRTKWVNLQDVDLDHGRRKDVDFKDDEP
ncbi:amino acid permease [Scheffersomyces xylosifermentans]|uniref:amino acid permease n=1 Tax=Scheffersomyces xylosifermentans TaxID=1304137 RepID=UPI00315CC02A